MTERADRPEERPVLPDQTGDDTDAGWGDTRSPAEREQADLERLLRERPPHHDR